MNAEVSKTVEEMTAEAKKKVEAFTVETTKQVETGMEQMTKSLETAGTFGRENMDALVLSSKRAAKAAEAINAELAAFAKKSYEDSLAISKELTSAKSMTELFEKQTAFAKTAMEGYISQMTKLNEMATEASKECFDPIAARFTAATDLMKAQSA